MKKILKFLTFILTVFMVLCDILEFLAVPLLLVIVGLLNSFSWKYYAISIGAYIALFIIAETVAYFIFKALDKKYTPIFEKKLEKYFNRFSKKG